LVLIEDLLLDLTDDLFNRNKFEYFINKLFTNKTFSEMSVRTLIPVYNLTENGVKLLDSTCDSCRVSDVILASTAAPYYFKPHKFQLSGKEIVCIDGGVVMNKPVQPNLEWLLIGTGVDKKPLSLDWSYWGISTYMSTLIGILVQANEELVLNSPNVRCYIDVSVKDLKINMSNDELKKELIAIGQSLEESNLIQKRINLQMLNELFKNEPRLSRNINNNNNNNIDDIKNDNNDDNNNDDNYNVTTNNNNNDSVYNDGDNNDYEYYDNYNNDDQINRYMNKVINSEFIDNNVNSD
jgi:patatin-like phospholipase/acyl hydrolase